MLHIVLYQPEIPGNTGNIMRLAHNSGAQLSLIKPLGFELSDARLKRAGLDYQEWVNVRLFESLEDALSELPSSARVVAYSTKATFAHTSIRYTAEDVLLFGPETRGLPNAIRERFHKTLVRIPMREGSRSLNLANAVAIGLYEAYRQLGFPGSAAEAQQDG